MKSTCWFQRVALTALLCVVVPFIWGCGNGSQSPDSSTLPTSERSTLLKFESEEYMLYGDVNVGGGETEIAVNPTDPNNIIIGILAGKHRLADGKLPDDLPSTTDQRLGEPDWCYSVLAVTHDRGQTWTFSEDQLRKKFDLCNCFDPFVEAGSDGTMYWGCLPEVSRDGSDYKVKGSIPNRGGPVAMRGGSYIMSSTDKGKTWSEPAIIMGSDQAARWPNGGKNMVWEGSSPWDRAEVYIDNSTGTLYATGHGRGGSPLHKEDSVTASHDKGKTWGPVYTWDSEGVEYPQSGGGSIGAGNGLLAVAYIASKVPDQSAKCPCLVFGTSRDDGKTFERHIVPDAISAAGSSGSSPVTGTSREKIYLAVDQNKPGRYAVMTQSPSGNQLPVYITEDYGSTWSGPIVGAQAPSNAKVSVVDGGNGAMLAAIKYSRNGDLGIIWRAAYSDKSFDVWSSVSRDGGKTFSTVRVSHGISPWKSRERGHFFRGDDYWDLDFDNEFAHFVWTDSRPGFLANWYGRVPLSAYWADVP